MRSIIFAMLLVPLAVTAQAETVDWTLGKSIDCPVVTSLPNKPLPRTVILPGGTVTEIPQSWFDDAIEVRYIRNTVSLKLKDPVFSGTISVYDDKGNLYLFNVRAARPDEKVDDTLILRPGSDGSSIGVDGNPISGSIDSDGAITELMVAMVSSRPSDQITAAIQTRVEDGKLVTGTKIIEDDSMAWYLVRMWQGPRLTGFETVFRYKGKNSFRVNTQRWWFPGALAIYATDQVFQNPQSPTIDVQPNQAIKLFFVVGE